MSEYNKKLVSIPNAYDTSQDKTNPTPTAPPLLNRLQNNHPLSLVPRNYRNTLVFTEHTSQGNNFRQSPATHIALHQSNIDDTDKQIVEQPHAKNFGSQNNHLFSLR